MSRLIFLFVCVLPALALAEQTLSSRELAARNAIELVYSESTPLVIHTLQKEEARDELLMGLIEKARGGDMLAFSTLSEIFILATEFHLTNWAIPTTQALLRVALSLPQEMTPPGREQLSEMAQRVADHLHHVRRALAHQPQKVLHDIISVFVYEYATSANSRSLGATVLAPEFASALLRTDYPLWRLVSRRMASILEEVPETSSFLISSLEFYLEVQMDRNAKLARFSKNGEAVRLFLRLLWQSHADVMEWRDFLTSLSQKASKPEVGFIQTLLNSQSDGKGSCFDLFD